MYRVLLLLLVAMVTVGKELGEDTPIPQKEVEWLNTLFYIPREPRVRKEYRMLTEEERNDFHRAFNMLKEDTSVSPNKYDLVISLHTRRSTRNSAHRGPGFLGWHRVYLLMFENALREKIAHVTVPYWDTTIDARLKLPRRSSLWSEDFMGNGDGHVTTGSFANWKTQKGSLYRTVGNRGQLLSEVNITRLMKFDHIGNISYPRWKQESADILELTHNANHRYIGGEMTVIETAAEDPIFFVLHSFVSSVWEIFRNHQRSRGIDPETDWEMYYGKARHHKYSPMGLGNLFAIDGSSEVFAENIIYADQPSCSKAKPDCGTPYLYCRVSVEQCFPWTIREYNEIKQSAEANGVSFMRESLMFILEKSKSPEERYSVNVQDTSDSGEALLDVDLDQTQHEHGHDDHDHHEHDPSNQGHDANKGHEEHEHDMHSHPSEDDSKEKEDEDVETYSDNDPDDDVDVYAIYTTVTPHTHNGHAHSHAHDITALLEIVKDNLSMVVLAGAILVLAIVSIVSKCASESCSCKSACCSRSTTVLHYNIERADEITDSLKRTPRAQTPDNIYTVTVTSNNDQLEEGTFVRFAKYEGTGSGLSLESYKLERPSGVDAKDNYLDMSYASRSLTQETVLFERISEDEVDDIDMESSCNSFDNENFDLEGIKAAYYCSQDINEVVEDYDNVDFRRPKEIAARQESCPIQEIDMPEKLNPLTITSSEVPTPCLGVTHLQARSVRKTADKTDTEIGHRPSQAPPTPPPSLPAGFTRPDNSRDPSQASVRPTPRTRRTKTDLK